MYNERENSKKDNCNIIYKVNIMTYKKNYRTLSLTKNI